jgi:hypothetical protein
MTDVHRQVCLDAARAALRNRSNYTTWMHRAWNSNCPDATGFRYLVRGYRHDELSHSMVWGLAVVLPVPDEALLGAMIESDIVRVAELAWVNSNGHHHRWLIDYCGSRSNQSTPQRSRTTQSRHMRPPCYGYCRAVLTSSSLTTSNGTVI